MIKFRLYYDKEKAEEFLNNMSKRGYEFKSFCMGFFTFEISDENDFTYRYDFIGNKRGEELDDYLNIIKDSGTTLVQRWGPWGIFKKKGDFVLYSDKESKIKFYTKVRNMFVGISILDFFCMMFILRNCFLYKDLFDLICIIIVGLITLVFINQVFKYNKKIKTLRQE